MSDGANAFYHLTSAVSRVVGIVLLKEGVAIGDVFKFELVHATDVFKTGDVESLCKSGI